MIIIGNTKNEWPKTILEEWPRGLRPKIMRLTSVLATLGIVVIIERLRGARTLILADKLSQSLLSLIGRLLFMRVVWLAGSPDRPNGLLRIAAVFANKIIVPNQGVEVLFLRAKIASIKLALVYPPVPASENPPKNRSADTDIILACASLPLADGLGVFLRAAAEANDILGNIRVIIAGPTEEKPRLEWIAKELNIKHRLQLIPAGSPAWARDSDIYILPSLKDRDIPISLAYAAAFGKLVIATNLLNHREFIKHGENGLLIKPNSVAELSQAIINLARDKELANRLAANNRAFGEKHFTREAFEKKLKAILN